ncbi:hypothetical protein AAFC00_003380 [Neodothiora populina]
MASTISRLPSTNSSGPVPQLKISPQVQADLQHLSDLSHLLHHRNRNQHRRSAWYRHFSIFRRHVAILLSYLSVLAEQPTTHLGKHRKKVTDAKVQAQIQAELEFWRDVLMPKWHFAFSQVVADGRFAVIGVVLLAMLAQVARAVGLVGAYEAIGEEEVRRVLEQFAQEQWARDEKGRGAASAHDHDQGVRLRRNDDPEADEDFGEALKRTVSDDDDSTDNVGNAKALEREMRQGASSSCMAPEQDILSKSRDAMNPSRAHSSPPSTKDDLSGAFPSASSRDKKKVLKKRIEESETQKLTDRETEVGSLVKTDKKRKPKDRIPPSSSSKPVKKKKKKNAIDDLFSGL